MCEFIMYQKSVNKSGFVHKSEDTLFFIVNRYKNSTNLNLKSLALIFSCSFDWFCEYRDHKKGPWKIISQERRIKILIWSAYCLDLSFSNEMSALDQNCNMPFLRNEFSIIFEDLFRWRNLKVQYMFIIKKN